MEPHSSGWFGADLVRFRISSQIKSKAAGIFLEQYFCFQRKPVSTEFIPVMSTEQFISFKLRGLLFRMFDWESACSIGLVGTRCLVLSSRH